MAKKTNFENFIKTVNEVSTTAKERGIIQLYTEDDYLNGRSITVNHKEMLNFGSCSYLGLETDERLIEATIEAVKKYGVQFSSSRVYVSCGNYAELENLISKIFNDNILISQCVSLGHISVMPIVIKSDDIAIFDQQAHFSMQNVIPLLNNNNTYITILRHNKINELEQKIIEYRGKYTKIWYVIDGVYSMYGDFAPIEKLNELQEKYKQLHLYIDDAHGMSWAGAKGTGYIYEKIKHHDRVILGTSLNKAFAASGGAFIFPNEELRDKVRNWGGLLSHSGPIKPPLVGTAIASAKIHLSDEIYDLQNKLQEKIEFCNHVLKKYRLPVVSNSNGPIFFIGVGLTRVGYNMVKRLVDSGYYTNLGIYPAVPEACTGIRFTITNHLTFEDIEGLAKSIAYHLPKALNEENRTMKDIFRAFRKIVNLEDQISSNENPVPSEKNLTLKSYTSINEIDKTEWDQLFADEGAFNHDNLLLYENSFNNENEPENNWNFSYYIIKDNNHKTVLATFFTDLLTKDDMLSPERVSKEIEKRREKDPYYLTSKTFMMGSLITNGRHLYLDRNNQQWKKALMMLLDKIWENQEKNGTKTLFLRDFDHDDVEIRDFLCDQGLVKIELPENNTVYNSSFSDPESFFNSELHKKKRYYLKKDVLEYADKFKVEIVDHFENGISDFYQLYKNVQENNFSLNTFRLPLELFANISKSNEWEAIRLINKEDNKTASITLCAKSDKSYSAVILGMDYSIDKSYNLYKQSLYQMIKRGLELKVEKIHLGVTASETKKKLGATAESQAGYVQMKDNYNINLLESIKMNAANS